MGSTAVGRAFNSISDPISKGWDNAFNGQARELEYAQRVRGDQEKAADAAMKEQDEIKRQGGLTAERDRQKAKAKAAGANVGGRSGTLLTDPGSFTAGRSAADSIYGGRKTLLGS